MPDLTVVPKTELTAIEQLVGDYLLNSEIGIGAGDGLRTRYLNLGKVALYRVSYSRVPGIAAILLEAGAHSSEDRCT